MVNLTKYLEYSLSIFKDTDDRRYRETLMTLVGVYERELNIEKIDVVFMQYVKDENVIGEDFVFISNAHFKTSVTN